ncbi:MAG: 6-phosphogluconolactonase [Haliscomenobacter sp.]|nr:6-phosphogluconolactonase [Haliscomenobacter sp.]MBK9487746.1 6-phosphogluconolactonase [Haliscomenobacter sp.]
MTLSSHNTYPSVEALTIVFAEWLGELVASKDSFSIALSGGRTPIYLFDYLVTHYREKIDWQKIKFYWGDERCVPPDHADSNYRAALEHLLAPLAIPAENIFRIQGEQDPAEEAQRYAQVLRDTLPMVGVIPQVDLVLLGMGADGHTASLFPNRLDLLPSTQICEAVEHPESGQPRVTFTMELINQARYVAFLVTGADKAEKVRIITRGEKNSKLYPASYVNPRSGQLYWFFDEAAHPQP